jgi:hypothetical protein
MDEAWDELASCNIEQFLQTTRLLLAVLHNILQDPLNGKNKQLKASNKVS